jgi:UDP-glucose:(glucosyl)LPS alpha-1,2-glucosyltransferase
VPFKIPDFTANAKGGTELMTGRLTKYLTDNAPELLEFFDFYPSRVRDYDENRPSVLIVHDLADDPETFHLARGGWKNFDLIVFVSHWQYQRYLEKFDLDGSNCIVILNGVEDLSKDLTYCENMYYKWLIPKDEIRLIYHTTPHRGLEILVPAFIQLYEEWFKPNNINVVLDVYSSFGVYGWTERDEPYENLFKQCKEHPAINYHGAVSNEEVRIALSKAHVFAFPSIWVETSSLSLIEAMLAQCICLHPDLGALIETSCNLTEQYVYKTDHEEHFEFFKSKLQQIVQHLHETPGNIVSTRTIWTADVANALYNFDNIGPKWVKVLSSLKKAVELQRETDYKCESEEQL